MNIYQNIKLNRVNIPFIAYMHVHVQAYVMGMLMKSELLRYEMISFIHTDVIMTDDYNTKAKLIRKTIQNTRNASSGIQFAMESNFLENIKNVPL